MKYITLMCVLLCAGVVLTCTSADANVNAGDKATAKSKTVAAKDTIVPQTKTVMNKRPERPYMVSKSRPKTEIDHTYPFDLALTTGQGKSTSTKDVLKKGKPTVVLFWLTTCYPCRIEMAAIKKKYDQWQEETDFNLIAVSTDFDKNYDNYLKYVKDAEWPWEAYHDTNREFRNILPGELNGLPQTFVFDKNGEIAMHKKKFRSGDEDKLYEKVKLLAAK